MSLKDELENQVGKTFRETWKERNGTVVPDDDSIGLGNEGVNLDATVLYADLSESTALVDNRSKTFAAEIYKNYLYCAARIIRSEGGAITAYDGDRIMAVYIGDGKNSSAARTALKINWAVKNIINPGIRKIYTTSDYFVKQVIGIDTSNLLAAKTGIRGSNDLVWVGRAANYAAKLCSKKAYPTYITEDVYNRLNDDAKYSSGTNMWTQQSWPEMNYKTIYGSTYWWSIR